MESFQEDISKIEISNLPLSYFEGEIIVIDSKELLDEYIPEIKNNSVLGFDTETRPSFKKNSVNNVSLLQIAAKSEAYLIRLNKIGLPVSLIELLEDESVYKIGAAVRDDIIKLQKHNPFKPGGFIDLQEYVSKFNISGISLKKLSAIVLKCRISKSQRLSNWENDILSIGQLRYAATDAWVCHEIYLKLLANLD